jgi:uncharacterized protein YecE (DUF72 family)
MPAPRKNGVFCLEGAWERRLDDRTSVLPSLDLLERRGHIRYIHRDVGTEEELYHYLAKWSQRGYGSYGVLYFAFHGVKGGIKVGRGTVPLSDLAEKLQGTAAGRVVYFGSCSVMRDRDAVADFQKESGAKAVVGYRKDVDWVESAAFDLMLLASLTGPERIDARINRVRARYPDLSETLGFESFPTFDRAGR